VNKIKQNKRFALKVLPYKFGSIELNLLRNLSSSPFLIGYEDSFSSAQELIDFIVFEYCEVNSFKLNRLYLRFLNNLYRLVI
jgi:hypothetical protein